MSAEENKAIARRYWDTWNTGNVAILHELGSADYVHHDGAGMVVRRIPGHNIPRFRTAFPDLHFVIEDVFAEGDQVVVRWTAHGTHRGDIEIVGSAGAIPPTGKPVTFFGIDIYHITGGDSYRPRGGGGCWRSSPLTLGSQGVDGREVVPYALACVTTMS